MRRIACCCRASASPCATAGGARADRLRKTCARRIRKSHRLSMGASCSLRLGSEELDEFDQCSFVFIRQSRSKIMAAVGDEIRALTDRKQIRHQFSQPLDGRITDKVSFFDLDQAFPEIYE